MRRWEFRLVEEQGARKWAWSYTDDDGKTHGSPATYDSLMACIDSAMAHGYGGGGKIIPGISKRLERADC